MGKETTPLEILKGRGSGNNIVESFSHRGASMSSALVTMLGTRTHVFIFKAFNGTAI